MKKYLAVVLLWCFACSAWAEPAPMTLMQTTTNQVIAALNANKATLQTKPAVVRNIMNQYLMPHLAVEMMARSVLGRNAWDAATPAQRQQFVQEFKRLMLNTYSSALASYKDQTVQYLPMRDASGSQVQINSKIVRNDGPPISVNYQLMSEDGHWKVYDFSVEGVSMLRSFRAQFADELARSGLDGLLKKLAGHNTQTS